MMCLPVKFALSGSCAPGLILTAQDMKTPWLRVLTLRYVLAICLGLDAVRYTVAQEWVRSRKLVRNVLSNSQICSEMLMFAGCGTFDTGHENALAGVIAL